MKQASECMHEYLCSMCICIQVNVSSLYFTFGGVSKLIATLITYPVQVFQTRARVSSGTVLYVCSVCSAFDLMH